MWFPRATGGAAFGLLISLTLSCNPDGSAPGAASACTSVAGDLIGDGPACASSLETPQDGCWHLVECGVIPVANPEDDANCCFDMPTCVRRLERMDPEQLDDVLLCISHSSCDELVFPGSPDRPRRDEQSMPACLQLGNL